jgi:hypothetical protein
VYFCCYLSSSFNSYTYVFACSSMLFLIMYCGIYGVKVLCVWLYWGGYCVYGGELCLMGICQSGAWGAMVVVEQID